MKAGLKMAALCLATTAACAGPQSPARGPGDGYADPGPALTREILRQDSAVFRAFNAHDLDGLMAYFSDDLEFYHDMGGLQDFREVAEGFEGLFAMDNGLRRDLVPGTSQVYPVAEYGAIQTGSHRFCHQENGRDDCGTFEFTTVWKRSAPGWQMTRVLSYGH